MAELTSNSKPLTAFWWRAKPNFGDALSQIVTEYASCREVKHKHAQHVEMFALGSIIQVAERNYRERKSTGYKPWIWGSGLMGPIDTGFLDHVRIAMLRGPLTASLLGVPTELYGDPGLLTADAMPAKAPRTDKVGFLVHHSQLEDGRIQRALKKEPSLEYIDVRDDPFDVCEKISQCRHVISASLHGLVVADSYGIPNTWLEPGDHPRLKYYDYAASIGRVLPLPLKMGDLVSAVKKLPDGPLDYTDGIDAAKETLLTHFPADLKGSGPYKPVLRKEKKDETNDAENPEPARQA